MRGIEEGNTEPCSRELTFHCCPTRSPIYGSEEYSFRSRNPEIGVNSRNIIEITGHGAELGIPQAGCKSTTRLLTSYYWTLLSR